MGSVVMLIMFKPKAMTQQDRPTAKEMLDLIKRLPDSKSHIHICCITGKHCVTNEFFAGAFAGRAFEGNTYEEAAEQLIDYMYAHIGHDSIVGRAVIENGIIEGAKAFRDGKIKHKENGNI